MFRKLPILAALGLLIAHAPAAVAQNEQVVEIASRGQKIRTILIKPEKPIGSIILIAGGHGVLNIDAAGKIGWGAGNHVIRTRAEYAKAGYVVAVPDAAPDLKGDGNGKKNYRWSDEHARDIGAVVKYLRGIAQPVYLNGTSRGALTVTNAGAKLTGPDAPDALIISSGMISHIDDQHPSAERNVGNLARIKQPILILYHEKDGCSYTPASSGARGKALMTGSKKADLKFISGGGQLKGDPCQAQSPHGFLGQDAEAVKAVTDWLAALPK